MDTQSNPGPNVTPTPPNSPPGVNTSMAILSYLGVLIIIPFLTEAYKDPYVKFHIKQGLILIVAWVIISLLRMVPFAFILWLGLLALMIVGIINAASGKEKELPLIGQFARHFNF